MTWCIFWMVRESGSPKVLPKTSPRLRIRARSSSDNSALCLAGLSYSRSGIW